MAISVGGSRKGVIAEINVTPMADVMIVLLIIFMVATPILAQAPVRLPAAQQALEKRGERLELVVRASGDVAFEGALLSPDALGLLLAERGIGTAALGVLVQADRDASYRDVARVLAACRRAGIGEIALAAELRPGSPPGRMP